MPNNWNRNGFCMLFTSQYSCNCPLGQSHNYTLILPMQLLKILLFQIPAYFVAKRKSPSPPGWSGGGKSLKKNFTQSFYFQLTFKFQTLENRMSGFSNWSSSVVWPEIYHFSPFSFSSASVCGRNSVLLRFKKNKKLKK